jgi:hypothetical protein
MDKRLISITSGFILAIGLAVASSFVTPVYSSKASVTYQAENCKIRTLTCISGPFYCNAAYITEGATVYYNIPLYDEINSASGLCELRATHNSILPVL